MLEDKCMRVYMRSEESEVRVDVKCETSKGAECMSEMSMSDGSARGHVAGRHVSRVTMRK